MDVPAVLRRLLGSGLTQAELAQRLFTTQQSVSRWAKGEREPGGPARELIREVAVERGVIVEDAADRHVVRIMGRVGGGATIEPDYEQVPPDGIEQVELPYPVGEEMIGFRVIGDSMAPTYEENSIIIVDREQPFPTERMIGLPAAILAYGTDGERRRYLKRIKAGGRPHMFHLESINDRTPTIRNVRIIWASPVRMIIPEIGTKIFGPDRRRAQARPRRGASPARRWK